MKFVLPLTLVAALAAGVAQADCARPDVKIDVPNGSKASKDEMLAVKKAITEYNAAVETYSACMAGEQDAEIAKAGDKLTQEDRDKIVTRYSKPVDQEVDKLKKIADKFNAEIRAFKAKNPA